MDKKLPETANPWVTESTELVYDNPWIAVTNHQVIQPGGGKGIYGVVHFKNTAVGVVPLDEDNNVWLVGQYRYPHNAYSWEIPEGGGELGEDSIEAAKRELLEETGIIAQHWEKILEMDLSNSATDEKAVIYLARVLEFTAANPEDCEDLLIRKIPFEELYRRVLNGEIRDSLTVAATLRVKLLLG